MFVVQNLTQHLPGTLSLFHVDHQTLVDESFQGALGSGKRNVCNILVVMFVLVGAALEFCVIFFDQDVRILEQLLAMKYLNLLAVIVSFLMFGYLSH